MIAADSAVVILPLLPPFSEKRGRTEESWAVHQSSHTEIEREREWDGVLRKRRCRRLGLAEGSPSRNIYTHARIHRGRITLIYLVRQQLASVFSVLTPALHQYYCSFSSPLFGAVSVFLC